MAPGFENAEALAEERRLRPNTGRKPVRITAALVPEKGAPFRLEALELADPGPDELIVRVAACGVCQTDVHGRDDYFGIPFPCVFGHEGAGIVERVGAAVTKVRPGDRVIMTSPSCGACAACARGLPGYCAQARRIKFGGKLRDGRLAVPFGGFRRRSFSSRRSHARACHGRQRGEGCRTICRSRWRRRLPAA